MAQSTLTAKKPEKITPATITRRRQTLIYIGIYRSTAFERTTTVDPDMTITCTTV